MRINNETARERLDDIRELEPTSNSDLRDRWGMDTTKDVARYLREELGENTYRDENSKIRANAAEPEPVDDTPEEPDTATDTDTSEPAENEATELSIPTPDEPITDAREEDANGAESVDVVLEAGTPSHTHSSESSGEMPAQMDTADTATVTESGSPKPSSVSPPARSGSCPDCGAPLLDGETIEVLLREQAQEQESTRRFIDANTGADPEWACRDIYDCGYYVEDGDPQRFDSPSSGWGKLLAGAGVGAAALAGAAKIATKQESDTGGPWDGV